jgi:hypothetical protein
MNDTNQCDICKCELETTMFDGRTVVGAARHPGPWAYMCPECFSQYGNGLGMGRGQRFTRRDKHSPWVCVEGRH